jgi:hypothetical protein
MESADIKSDIRVRVLVERVRNRNLTYLTDEKLHLLAERCEEIEKKELGGIVIEVGSALGGSSIVLAKCKKPSRTLKVFDTFGMIPPPSASDPPAVHERYAEIKSGNSDGIKGETYYGYRTNLVEEVKLNMEQFGINLEEENIFLIKGLIQETLHIDEPVALAHIDVDWYESVLCALQRLVPKLIPGGSLVIDDYYHYEGCKMATDEFFRNKGKHFVLNNIAGSMVVTRRKRRFGIFRL